MDRPEWTSLTTKVSITRSFGGYVTNFAALKDLKLIKWMKGDF